MFPFFPQAPPCIDPLAVQQELKQLRTEVTELRNALNIMTESVAESAPIPSLPLATNETQQYDRVQYIPLMMYSGPEPEDDEPSRYGITLLHANNIRS